MALIDRNLNRRRFLKGAAALAGGAALVPAFQGLSLLGERGQRAYAALGDGSYGPLFPTKDLRDGVEHLALPKEFRYRSFGLAGMPMTRDGLTPLAHDGMAAYSMPDGKLRLVRNHEDRSAPGAGSVKGDPTKMYDSKGGGGTTTLEINPFTRTLERDWVSLNGTIVNCAGGETPWKSWITCEETNAGPPQGWDKQHGYCFEVQAGADSTVQAVAVPDMGRFAHEAVAVDFETWIVYETEDSGNTSGFYRFLPKTPGKIVDGGKLQMLGIEGWPQYDTLTGQTAGKQLPVKWYDIADPNPPGQGSEDVFNQGWNAGAATFARLEGCWYSAGSIFFASTSGGNAGQGQIWEYKPEKHGDGWLRMVFESPAADVLNSPDNITISPQGALVLCEDGSGQEYLHGLTQDGEIFRFAENLDNGFEWAGACFGIADPAWNDVKVRGGQPPLGSWWERVTLFVNRQGNTSGANPPPAGNEGYTFAIWGPWKDGAL